MATDNRALGAAKAKLAEMGRQRRAEMERRAAEVFAVSERARELDTQIRATVGEFFNAAMTQASDEMPQGVVEKNRALRCELRDELRRVGFPDNYLDDEYMCEKCCDSGYVRTEMCSCLKKIFDAEKRAALSNLLKVGSETFETFDLSFYSDEPAAMTGVSPRDNMKSIYELCYRYAHKFGKNPISNLFLNGPPGLGKTFLSACIARVVAQGEYSVVYETAGTIFSKYEDEQFSKVKGEEYDETRDEIRRYLGCDLLIIDDLGTEMTTKFTNESLYEIINTRLVAGRKTIVNSNMSIDEMRERYTEQIMSRLEGEYQQLTFYGDDIRKKRNEV